MVPLEQVEGAPRLVALDPAGVINLHEEGIRWTASESARFFQIRIVSDEGDLIWTERVNSRHWQPDDSITLEEGREYFVRVDAYISRTRYLSSDYVPFRVGTDRQ